MTGDASTERLLLAPEFWGRGLATEGAREAIRFGWARTPLPRIISATAARNARSAGDPYRRHL